MIVVRLLISSHDLEYASASNAASLKGACCSALRDVAGCNALRDVAGRSPETEGLAAQNSGQRKD
jgi:hypothetical protein